MTSGSQQALDLLGKVLIDEGSRVLVETPSYLGALQAFSVYRPEFVSVDTDDDGLVPYSIDAVAEGARLLYALPNFQNPTGRSLSVERRLELVETCARLGLPLIEDDPYGALSYKGEPLPKMLAMNPDGVIYMGSFSKVLTPGIRLGYVVRPAAAGAPPGAGQAGRRPAHLAADADGGARSDQGRLPGAPHPDHPHAVRRPVPGHARRDGRSTSRPASTWTTPEGGMFIWVTLPKHIDAMKLLDEAIAQKVAFVPGAPFYANAPETTRCACPSSPCRRNASGKASRSWAN